MLRAGRARGTTVSANKGLDRRGGLAGRGPTRLVGRALKTAGWQRHSGQTFNVHVEAPTVRNGSQRQISSHAKYLVVGHGLIRRRTQARPSRPETCHNTTKKVGYKSSNTGPR